MNRPDQLVIRSASKAQKTHRPRPSLEQRIAMYLNRCAPAVSGSGGHNQTFSVACALTRGFGLDEEAALAWLTVYNQKCQPHWSIGELRHKVRSALGASQNRPRGYLIQPEEMSSWFSSLAEPDPSIVEHIADAEAALHLHLSEHMPLACVTSSGGKSLHGWYNVFDLPENDQRGFIERAVSLGADRATWCLSQFCRLPDGLRDGRIRQICFYLNPRNCVSL